MALGVRRVEDSWGVWNGYNCEFISPQCLWITRKEIEEYVKEKPFPKDPKYSLEDCIVDLTRTSGTYLIPCKYRKTAEYIADMIRELI